MGEAHSGGEALDLVRRLRPDLVLLDIYLLDMSEQDVLRRLREDEETAVDVIAVTAAKDDRVARLRRAHFALWGDGPPHLYRWSGAVGAR